MSSTHPARLGFLAGVVAGAAGGAVLALARIATGAPSLPEVVGEAMVALVPPTLFDRVLSTLTFAAKPLFLTAVVVGYLLLAGVLGALSDRLATRTRDALPRFAVAACLALAAFLAVGLVLLPILGKGVFGWQMGTLVVSGPLLLAAFVYAAVLALAEGIPSASRPESPGVAALESRRRLLRALAGGSVVVVALVGVGRAVSLLAANSRTARRPHGADETLPPEITPTPDFYVVSKNLGGDPVVDGATWTLEIGGLVNRPYSLSYDQLRALPAVNQTVTLECISNEVGGDLMGNARWKGVRFADLLNQAGVKPEAKKVVLYAADGYEDSVPVDRALSPANLLAYEMNGEKLLPAHGFPARLLVPGIYGMKNVKWVTRVSLVDYDYQGYWQRLGWSDGANVKTMSRIDRPESSLTVTAGPIRAGGVAFAGDRGIMRVELSLDEGQTWQPTQLRPALSPYAWALWTADLTLDSGTQKILVRAVDGSNYLQISEGAPPLPDGASGLHWVMVHVQEG